MELIKNTSSNGTNTNSNHSNALQQLIEVSWKATRGLVDSTESEIAQLIEKLGSAGKISSEEKTQLAMLVSKRLTDSRKRFLSTVDQQVKTAVQKITSLIEDEVQGLEKSISSLEQKIKQL